MKLLKRRKESSVLPQVDDTKLLDTQEQEAIVQTLQLRHARQSFAWQVIFAAMMSTFSVFFFSSAYLQLVLPWDLKYHSYFMDEMGSISVVIADVAEACVYASLTWGLLWKKGSCRHRLWFSFGAGFPLAVFWCFFMTRLSRMRWEILWLPFGPCSCAGICIYVDHLIEETGRDIINLRSAMYHYKKS